MYQKGRKYRVLCLIEETNKIEDMDEDELWRDESPIPSFTILRKGERITPLINHPHNDIENGQKETHYHIDNRFLVSNITFDSIRVSLPLSVGKLEYRTLKCRKLKIDFSTPVSLIRKSKLSHKCIHKGKCPHRGYDLSNEQPILNSKTNKMEIVCPLHSLRFDANSKQLIKDQ